MAFAVCIKIVPFHLGLTNAISSCRTFLQEISKNIEDPEKVGGMFVKYVSLKSKIKISTFAVNSVFTYLLYESLFLSFRKRECMEST